MSAIFYTTGIVVWSLIGLAALALSIIGLVWLFNRASWWVLNAYGGIKTFKEYRHWYLYERAASKESGK
jgi:hypothetical protein